MTNEEAVKELNALLNMCDPSPLTKELEDALKMAIKALEQQRNLTNEELYQSFIKLEAENERLHDALEAQPTGVDETYLSIKDAISELKAMREHIVGYMSIVGTTAYDMGIEALEAQPCIEDYPTCTECEHYDSEKHYCPRFCQVIKDALAEAQPKKGEWIVFRCGDTDTFKCSECGMRVVNPYQYCPNCGAEMSGGAEDES